MKKNNKTTILHYFTALIIMLLSLLTMLVACNKVPLVAPSGIGYDGNTIYWEKVLLADFYTVSVNGGEAVDVTETHLPYVGSGDLTITLKACTDNKKMKESDTVSAVYRKLDEPTNVSISKDGSGVTWNTVKGADGYKIILDGTESEMVYKEPIIKDLSAGDHSIQVKAVVSDSTDYYSYFTKTPFLFRKLAAPDNVSYDGESIRWNAIAKADGYSVYVNGKDISVNEKNEKIATVSSSGTYFDANGAGFNVKIKALGNALNTVDSDIGQTKQFDYLGTVDEVKIEDGVVVWNPIDGAIGYQIKENGIEKAEPISTCRYEELVAGTPTTITIRPIGGTDKNYFSYWSAVKEYNVLGSPTISWNSALDLSEPSTPNNNIQWEYSQDNQAGFRVSITLDGNPVPLDNGGMVNNDKRSFAYGFADVGTYTVRVQSIAADTGTMSDSRFSKFIEVVRLAAPTVSVLSDAKNLKAGFTVTCTPVSGATGYCLMKDEGVVTTISNTQFYIGDVVDASVTAEQVFNYTVSTVGKTETDENHNIYVKLGCTKNARAAFSITVKAMPAPMTELSGNMDGFNFKWNAVVGAGTYAVNVNENLYEATESLYDLRAATAEGNYSVSVCTMGNGTNVLASHFTAPISVKRLAPPKNLSVGTTVDEGRLTYDRVDGARSYDVYLDSDTNPASADTLGNINDRISTEGSTIYVTAVANAFGTDNVYYMSSVSSNTLRVVRLSEPTFPQTAFTNTQFLWNAPSNIRTEIYTPTYRVFNGNNQVYNGEKNGTSMNIADLTAGEYVFYVQAIGDGTNFVNSKATQTPAVIRKLVTPSVSIEAQKYAWSGIPGANGYNVTIDGVKAADITHVAGKTEKYTHSPLFTEQKIYTVTIKACGDGGITTIDSDTCRFTQATVILAQPEFTYRYSDESYNPSGTIDVTITRVSAHAAGYYFIIGGVTGETLDTEAFDGTAYSYNTNAAGKFTVAVKARGACFDGEVIGTSVYYIDSYIVGGSATTITLLPAVGTTSLLLSLDGILSWNVVPEAVRYEYQISYDDGDFSTAQKTQNTSITIPPEIMSGSYEKMTFKVRALGDGDKIITSAVAEKNFDIG